MGAKWRFSHHSQKGGPNFGLPCTYEWYSYEKKQKWQRRAATNIIIVLQLTKSSKQTFPTMKRPSFFPFWLPTWLKNGGQNIVLIRAFSYDSYCVNFWNLKTFRDHFRLTKDPLWCSKFKRLLLFFFFKKLVYIFSSTYNCVDETLLLLYSLGLFSVPRNGGRLLNFWISFLPLDLIEWVSQNWQILIFRVSIMKKFAELLPKIKNSENSWTVPYLLEMLWNYQNSVLFPIDLFEKW